MKVLRGNRFWALVCVLAGLLAGCRTPSSTSHPPAKTHGMTKAGTYPVEDVAAAHTHYSAGVLHDLQENPAAAIKEYYLAALSDPGDESLILEVSRRLILDKQPDKAIEILKRATARPNASAALYARLGLVYLQTGKSDAAIAADRMAIKRDPKLLSGYQNLFLTYLNDQHPAEALKVLDEASRQESVDVEFLVNLAELYVNLFVQSPTYKEAARAKALAVMARAEKLKPTRKEVLLKMADNLGSLGENKRAAAVYEDLLKGRDDDPGLRDRVRRKLAAIYIRDGDSQHAGELLQAILREDPTNVEACYRLGRIAYEQKKPGEAVEYFSKAVLLSPEFEQAYYDLALAQLADDKPGLAQNTLARAVKMFQQNFVLEWLQGHVNMRLKAYPEAIRHFTAAEVIAKATDPGRLDDSFYFQLGAAYERKGDYDSAQTYFEKCLKLAPDSAEALNYLGYMWAEHGTNLNQALDLIEKANKLSPQNAAYLDSLGWVLFKLDRPKEALAPILKAVELSPEPDATVLDHLGDIYAALKQDDKAREAWGKSLKLEANEVIKKKLDRPKP